MTHYLVLCLAVVLAVMMGVSLLTIAEQPSSLPNTAGMTYTEWCQYMDQLSQNLRIAVQNFWLRGSIDFAVQLVGVAIIAKGEWVWQQTIGGLLILAGAVDMFAYTMPPASEAALDYKMWKEAGASRMWLYPCTASTGDR